VAVLLTLTAALALLGRSRSTVYAVLASALSIYLFAFVGVLGQGPLDHDSTRDAAVELGAWALLRGDNPWRVDLGTPITTGPVSILFAVPFVLMSGHSVWLTMLFWLSFFFILLWNDAWQRHQTWPVLVLLFMTGIFDARHTLRWNLDELYYPMSYLAAAYILIERRKFGATGALFALVLLTRLNYTFLTLGFLSWFWTCRPWQPRDALRGCIGFTLACGVVVLPFIVVIGGDLWNANPMKTAVQLGSRTAWPETNGAFHLLNQVASMVGPTVTQIVKSVLAVVIMTFVAWRLSRLGVRHPFWHVMAGGFVAHAVVWVPGTLPADYSLMVILPAMLAISLTDFRTLTTASSTSGNIT
jgi:hypothetical protein